VDQQSAACGGVAAGAVDQKGAGRRIRSKAPLKTSGKPEFGSPFTAAVARMHV